MDFKFLFNYTGRLWGRTEIIKKVMFQNNISTIMRKRKKKTTITKMRV